MAGLRKGCCYRKVERSYTRKSKYKAKGYIKAIPNHKISRFQMGDNAKKFAYKVKLVSKSTIQIRHNAIESARLVVNRKLEVGLGKDYFFIINIFPHHALRENRKLGGAHADGLQTGMAHSFGKVVNRAAQVRRGATLFTAFVNDNGLELAKTALKSANPRLPGQCTIQVEELKVTV